jgi:Fur family transcriptional regulator, peroxide stress response regulator
VGQYPIMQETKIKDYLLENGVRPVNKRVRIMNYLISKRNHPTAEMIYLELINEIAGLSKTTVYNTLNLFVQEGIVRALNIDSNELRYDHDISQHGHFKCKECGEVYDFSMNTELLQDLRLKNFVLDDYQFSIKGICSICQKGKNP